MNSYFFLFTVGQAWLPLLSRDGRVCTGEHNLPVAVSLPPGYLAMVDQIGKVSDAKGLLIAGFTPNITQNTKDLVVLSDL